MNIVEPDFCMYDGDAIHARKPDPNLSRNVCALVALFSYRNDKATSIIKDMYEANIVSIDDIYDAVKYNSGNGITDEILDMLIIENKLDSELCVEIIGGFEYSHSQRSTEAISEKQIEIFERIKPFMSESIQNIDILSLPLWIVERICPIDSLELTDSFFNKLLNSKNIDQNLLSKIIQLLLSKQLDDDEYMRALGKAIITFNQNQNRRNGWQRANDTPSLNISYLDEFLAMVKDHPKCLNICMNMFLILRYGFVDEHISKSIVDMIDNNNLLDTEESYDLLSYCARSLSSRSSDRMKKYYKHISTYIELFVNFECLYGLRMPLSSHSGKIDEKTLVLNMLQIHSLVFGMCEKLSEMTSYKMDMDEFVEKLRQNMSFDTLDKAAIFVVNLLDLMESDDVFNEWIESN